MPDPKQRIPRLSDDRTLAPTQAALALELVTPMDLLRLKSIARLHARGLPADIAWDDLLQEAITRVLTGKRVRPPDLPMVVFLAGVMRSLRTDYIRRGRRYVEEDDAGSRKSSLVDPSPDPERALIAVEELARIRTLFAEDPAALSIIRGMAEGLDAGQIRLRFRMSRKNYDTARKRMRRCLLREGLTCGNN